MSEYDPAEDKTFSQLCLGFCGQIGTMLHELDDAIEERMPALPHPHPEQFDSGELVAGGLLLLVCGMLADEDGGRDILMAAAEKLRAENTLPMAEEIRKAAEQVFNTLGITRTSHLWN